VDIGDGDLVRLARDGDRAAFRLLVERHLPMARARAARLCPQPDDADDAVQDAFLQAFIALDRLRDPEKFAGWLGGIVTNVCRAQRRRPPLTLLGDWPENLHPASAGTLPSAEDLDRADVLSRAVAGLPPGQRYAVTRFYYADQPAGQAAVTPGAAKASLHKARRRLREYITAHRPDLIPALTRRIPMTVVRIAHADPWPGRTPDGSMTVSHVLVILADDAGHRALPVRLPPHDNKLWRLLSRPGDRDEDQWDDPAEEMTGRLLQAAGVTVAGVTVTDLGPGVTATRIGIAGPGRTRPVTASLADGLTIAVITGAPLAVDDPVMDRLARPVTGPDLLSPFRSQQTPSRSLSRRFEPRNMAFTDGLDYWQLRGTFLRQGTGFDYSATTEDGRAILAAAGPEPAGFAFLAQEIEPDDYRGRTVTFRGELRTTNTAGRAGLALRVTSPGRSRPASPDPWGDPANHIAFATGTGAWTRYEVTAQIPADASLIRFGVFLRAGQADTARIPARIRQHGLDDRRGSGCDHIRHHRLIDRAGRLRPGLGDRVLRCCRRGLATPRRRRRTRDTRRPSHRRHVLRPGGLPGRREHQ
jgi:RNA polymerase sigma factor (sigma-70 family)